jgi:hypothetical protein
MIKNVLQKMFRIGGKSLHGEGTAISVKVDGKKIKDICKENGVEIKDEWLKKKEN